MLLDCQNDERKEFNDLIYTSRFIDQFWGGHFDAGITGCCSFDSDDMKCAKSILAAESNMSSNNEMIKDNSEQNDDDVSIVARNEDWFLVDIVALVNKYQLEIGITLTVGGSIVSGTLISGKSYFSSLSEIMVASASGENDLRVAIGSAWGKFTAVYDKPENVSEDWEPPPPAFIHLKEARYYSPGSEPIPTMDGSLWRGRISSVDGFNIGKFGVE